MNTAFDLLLLPLIYELGKLTLFFREHDNGWKEALLLLLGECKTCLFSPLCWPVTVRLFAEGPFRDSDFTPLILKIAGL